MMTKQGALMFLAWSALVWSGAEEIRAAQAPVEIGKVAWLRDLEEGLSQSKASGKPVFLLFQEVPGCSGCRDFGQAVLSDERMVQAIENHFVPVFIPNNQPGKSAEVLQQYGEPSWNYQVIRFLDKNGKDLIPRKDKIWTASALAERMVLSLEKAGRPADNTLLLLAGRRPVAASTRQKVAFAQACFWTGEMRLGQIDGVVRTEAGFFDGREVTLVEFDPVKIALPDLVKEALARQCADRIYTATLADKARVEAVAESRKVALLDSGYRAAPVSDQKKQIQGTSAEGRPMTSEQATKVNAFIRSDPAKAKQYLTNH
jgi:hypothetical protein